MNYRALGNSSLQVSQLGFGCMSLNPGDPSSTTLLHHAIDRGINFFDTADLYNHGDNEVLLGNALKHVRKEMIIATKVGNEWKQDGSGWKWNPGKKYILTAIHKSLERLQTDYIDLYQLHGGTINDDIDDTISAFQLLQQQGKIRYYGISSIRPNVIRAYAYRSSMTSVMMQYSLLDRRPEESCFDLLYDKNIGVLARGSLAGGLLIDKPATSYLNYSAGQVKDAASAIRSLSNKTRSQTAVALQFSLTHPAISTLVVGMRTMEQLNAALKAILTSPLTDDELASLHNSVPLNYYREHR